MAPWAQPLSSSYRIPTESRPSDLAAVPLPPLRLPSFRLRLIRQSPGGPKRHSQLSLCLTPPPTSHPHRVPQPQGRRCCQRMRAILFLERCDDSIADEPHSSGCLTRHAVFNCPSSHVLPCLLVLSVPCPDVVSPECSTSQLSLINRCCLSRCRLTFPFLFAPPAFPEPLSHVLSHSCFHLFCILLVSFSFWFLVYLCSFHSFLINMFSSFFEFFLMFQSIISHLNRKLPSSRSRNRNRSRINSNRNACSVAPVAGVNNKTGIKGGCVQ